MSKALLPFVLYAVLAPLGAPAQLDASWTRSLRTDRSFIADHGQFSGLGLPGETMRYAVDEGAVRFLFHDAGLTIRLEHKQKNYYRQRGDREQPRMITFNDLLSLRWEGARTTTPEGLHRTDDHHTYAHLAPDGTTVERSGIPGYAELLYRQLYPGIDVRYTIHPEGGIKYALFLAPGADHGRARLRLPGDHPARIDANGDLRIETAFGDIVDHAPIAYYADDEHHSIPVHFTLKDGLLGFALGDHDPTRAVVIDPWTVTPPFPNSNRIWDVEVDANANVYIYGGDSPLRLRKYTPDGTLLWTYTTPWDTANYWLGSMIAHPNGDCFITAGTDPRIARISTAGTQVWSANGGAFDEYWRMAFNCDHTQLMLGGTRLTIGPTLFPIGFGRAFNINLNSGAVINSVNVAALSPSFLINNPNEIRAITSSPNGKYYFMTLDTIGALAQDLAIGYRTNNSYGFSYQVAGYGPTNMGINAMAATADHLFTLNGATLHKRNIYTGAIIGTATIPGGATSSSLGANSAQNGGIALDSCGFLYVGSGNGVYKFTQDLQVVASVSTPGAVYDVAVNHNGEVVACGNGFLTSVQLSSCAPPQPVCLVCLELAGPGTLCVSDGPITLTSNLPGGTWSGPGITSAQSGVFDPGVAGPGVHTVTYTPQSAVPCGIDTLTIVVSPCAPLSVCQNPDGTLSASNGLAPYTWQHQTTTQDCSACLFGCFFPPGCAVNVTSWTTWATGNGVGQPPNYPIQVIDAAGAVVTYTSLAAIPACTPCPPIEVELLSSDDVLCNGGSNGSATVIGSGGVAPYAYTWGPGNLTGPTQQGLAAGTYTVTATDIDGCTGALSVTIAEPPAIAVTLITSDASCAGNDGTALASATGGTGSLGYLWSPTGGTNALAEGLAPGTYTVTVSDANGCSVQVTATILQTAGPQITNVSTTPSDCDRATGTIAVSATGDALLFSIDGGATAQPDGIFTEVAGGTYTVLVTDSAGCQATVAAVVDTPPSPVPVISGPVFGCAGDLLQLTTTQPFAAYAWSTGSTGSVLGVDGPGVFTVTVTDANGCTGTSAPHVVTFEVPQAAYVASPPSPQPPGTTVQFTDASTPGGGTITGWSWWLGVAGSEAQGPDASWTYPDLGEYFIQLAIITANGCVDTILGSYLILPVDITVPNVFSPNGDGINDYFAIENIQFFRNELVIFNRWGMVVHEATNYRNEWRGTDVPDGTYYYVLRLADGREFTGHVTLLR
jgi:gliding motility-associated-like protein